MISVQKKTESDSVTEYYATCVQCELGRGQLCREA